MRSGTEGYMYMTLGYLRKDKNALEQEIFLSMPICKPIDDSVAIVHNC